METKKSIFIRLSNFKYNGLKRASLPLHVSTGKRKKLMRTTCYAEQIHICAETKALYKLVNISLYICSKVI